MKNRINIIGAGLSGLSAAYTLAKNGAGVRLISVQESWRAQSNLAEGGINAALDVMGEADTIEEHFLDTMTGGCELADPDMVRGLVSGAPDIVMELKAMGVPFSSAEGRMVQRSFGGQKKKRTAFVKSSTGKMLTTAMINAVRRYEECGLIERFSHHEFSDIITGGEADPLTGDRGAKSGCIGVSIRDVYTDEVIRLFGPVIMCCGGLNGFFSGHTTGTTANTGNAAAQLFMQGVEFGNLEFIQYHPTTAAIPGKRLLISEAARGEGGRLFFDADGDRIYFMEDKYGSRGNLMPRDVISREIALIPEGNQIYLDMTELSGEVWRDRLPDLRKEIEEYLHIDPACSPVPVSPGIHFFMGGILVDKGHATNIPGLFAAGECACAYHGANRLGGNSLLAAIYGGRVAAQSVMEACESAGADEISDTDMAAFNSGDERNNISDHPGAYAEETEADRRLTDVLRSGLSILRDEDRIRAAMDEIETIRAFCHSDRLRARLLLGEAMLKSAYLRRETRGAHVRLDHKAADDDYKKTTVAVLKGNETEITFRDTGR